jgi:hypothetical protein
VTIGVTTETLGLPEEGFRDRYAVTLLRGVEHLARFAERKGLEFNGDAYVACWRDALGRYRLAELPLLALASYTKIREPDERMRGFATPEEALAPEGIVRGKWIRMPKKAPGEEEARSAKVARLLAIPARVAEEAIASAESRTKDDLPSKRKTR